MKKIQSRYTGIFLRNYQIKQLFIFLMNWNRWWGNSTVDFDRILIKTMVGIIKKGKFRWILQLFFSH